MALKDKRLKVLNEVLNGMKVRTLECSADQIYNSIVLTILYIASNYILCHDLIDIFISLC